MRCAQTGHAAADLEVERLELTVDWAVENTVEADGEWAAHQVSTFGDRALPIAGPGAPLVSEFALMEYAAALGMSTDSGKAYVGKTLELRYRLPRLWEQVVSGRLPVWRAMRVAEHTGCLPDGGGRRGRPSARPGSRDVLVGPDRPARRGGPGPPRPRRGG